MSPDLEGNLADPIVRGDRILRWIMWSSCGVLVLAIYAASVGSDLWFQMGVMAFLIGWIIVFSLYIILPLLIIMTRRVSWLAPTNDRTIRWITKR